MDPPDKLAASSPSSYGLAAVDPPIPMLILERDLKIRWVSSAAVRELKLDPSRLIGCSWYALFPESQSRRALHEALVRGECDAIDLPRVPLSLGCGTRYFSLRLRPLRGADGSVESILGVGEDVTGQVEADQALRHSEERLASALWGAQAAYWSTDLRSGTSQISDQFFTMTGIDRAAWEAAAEPWCAWVHAEDAPMGCARYRAHLAGVTASYEHEYRLQTPRGWRWCQDRGKIIERDMAGHPIRMAGTTTDISARKALEISFVEALNREQRRLSHDLHEGLAQQLTGTALSLAGLCAEMGHDRPENSSRLKSLAGELSKAIETTRHLVFGLLPASIERGDLAPALHSLATQMSTADSLKVTCHTREWDARSISPEAAQHVYAIAQQVLGNAREHTEVKAVAMTLRSDGDYLVLVWSHEVPVSTLASHDADRLCAGVMAHRAQALGATLIEERLPSGSKRIRLRFTTRMDRPAETFKLKHGRCDCIPAQSPEGSLIRRK